MPSIPNAIAIARAAGVSRTVVSYVIHGKADRYGIAARTQERVRSAIGQLGCAPDLTIRNMYLGDSPGLNADTLRRMDIAQLTAILGPVLAEKGYRIVPITQSAPSPVEPPPQSPPPAQEETECADSTPLVQSTLPVEPVTGETSEQPSSPVAETPQDSDGDSTLPPSEPPPQTATAFSDIPAPDLRTPEDAGESIPPPAEPPPEPVAQVVEPQPEAVTDQAPDETQPPPESVPEAAAPPAAEPAVAAEPIEPADMVSDSQVVQPLEPMEPAPDSDKPPEQAVPAEPAKVEAAESATSEAAIEPGQTLDLPALSAAS